MRAKLKSLALSASYNYELISHLIVVILISGAYGVIESIYINTDTAHFKPLPGPFMRWSGYHLWMCFIFLVASFSLSMSHIQSFLAHKKKYTLLMGLSGMLLSLQVEDAAFFISRFEAIKANSWTVIPSGFAINIWFTYIPCWYIVIWAACAFIYWSCDRFATYGYLKWCIKYKISDPAIAGILLHLKP